MRLPVRPKLDPDLDARLVARCLEGDAGAWTALVRRYERLVYAIGRSYRLDDEDLGDLFQEVFAALVKGIPRLRDARALCRWIASTTDRIALATALRRRREGAQRVGDDTALERQAAEGPGIGADLEVLEAQTRVRLALGALSPRCQSLLEALYYAHPVPEYREISQRLGMPVGSIGPTRARCIERLREALARLEAEEGGINPGSHPTSSTEHGGGRRTTRLARRR